jgi:hypothetical protein
MSHPLAFTLFGSIVFWIVSLAILLIGIISASFEKGFPTFIGVMLAAAWLNFAVHIPFVRYTVSHPWNALGYFAFYLVLGTIWAVIKWYFYVRKILGKYNDLKEAYLERNNVKDLMDLTPSMKERFTLDTHSLVGVKVYNHKTDILFWMAYWPLSLLASIFNDFFKNLFNHVYTAISTSLQRMADKMFHDAAADHQKLKASVEAYRVSETGEVKKTFF